MIEERFFMLFREKMLFIFLKGLREEAGAASEGTVGVEELGGVSVSSDSVVWRVCWGRVSMGVTERSIRIIWEVVSSCFSCEEEDGEDEGGRSDELEGV